MNWNHEIKQFNLISVRYYNLMFLVEFPVPDFIPGSNTMQAIKVTMKVEPRFQNLSWNNLHIV